MSTSILGMLMPVILTCFGALLGYLAGNHQGTDEKVWRAVLSIYETDGVVSRYKLEQTVQIKAKDKDNALYAALDRLQQAGYIKASEPHLEPGTLARYYRVVRQPCDWPIGL